ncbi:MAG: hypothetical protein ACRDYE_01135, partial [Acidimicrobiales bacterium]
MSVAAAVGGIVGLGAMAAVALSSRRPSGPGRVGPGRRGPGHTSRSDPARWARPGDLGRLSVRARHGRLPVVTGRLVLGR